MSTGAGKDFLIKVDVGGGVFTQVGGLRSSGLSGAAEEIDITTIDEDQWKTIMDGAGIRSFGLSGSGLLKDTAPIDALRSAFLNQTLTEFQLVEVNGTWEGSFKITGFEMTGEYNGAQAYNLTLASSGEVTFT